VRRYSDLLRHPSDRFQPPLGATAREVPAAVEHRCDATEGLAWATQIANLCQRSLLGGVRFEMPPIWDYCS